MSASPKLRSIRHASNCMPVNVTTPREQSADGSPIWMPRDHAPCAGIPQMRRSAYPWRSYRHLAAAPARRPCRADFGATAEWSRLATPRAQTKFRQKSICVLFPGRAQRKILAHHPRTETGQELNLLLNSRFGVSRAVEQSLETIQVASQSAHPAIFGWRLIQIKSSPVSR